MCFQKTALSLRLLTAMAAMLVSGMQLVQAQTPVAGKVISINKEENTLTLQHPVVEGVAEEGETLFTIGAGDATWLTEGREIRGEIYSTVRGKRLEKIWPDDRITNSILDQTTRMLRRNTVERGSRAFRALGEHMPNIALINQYGEVIQPQRERNDYKVINFIFTRCAEPTMCPAATERMKRLQLEAKEAGIDNLSLYSISFDPDFDSPGILQSYASRYGIDTPGFHFLSGPERQIQDILQQIGIVTREENGTINHSMATVLVAPNGTIIFRRDGSNWSTNEYLARIEAHKNSNS